jgi:chromosome partitioning protein
MKTLTVLSYKGGAGKTTVSVSLALAARQAGLKVVVADIDPLHSAGEVLGAREESSSLLFETAGSKLFILQDACRRNGCDLLIIDTPTSPSDEILRALNISDFCTIVGRPTSLDIAAVIETVALVGRTRCPGLVVLNQCPPARGGVESSLVSQSVERLQHCGVPLAATKLRSRVAYQHAFAHNRAVTEWDPSGEAAADVLRLLAEVSDRMLLPDRETIAERAGDAIAELPATEAAPRLQAAIGRLLGMGVYAQRAA